MSGKCSKYIFKTFTEKITINNEKGQIQSTVFGSSGLSVPAIL